MNIIQKAVTKLLGLEVQKKAMSFGTQFMMNAFVPTYIKWWDTMDYLTNDSIYSIIRVIQQKAGMIPFYTYAASGELRTPVESDLGKLIKRPNPSQGADAFFQGLYSYYSLYGEAFIWLNRGGTKNGKVLEMYIIHPNNVELLPDPQDVWGTVGYIFDFSEYQVTVPKEDVIHWSNFNPEFDATTRIHLRGYSPLRAAQKRIQMDKDSIDAAVAMFQNGGSRFLLYEKTHGGYDISEIQKQELMQMVKENLNGKSNKGALAFAPGDWGGIDLGMSSTDMQLMNAQELVLKRLCAVFGVPYELFQSETSFANKETAMKFFVLNTVQPMVYSLRDELNRVLSDGKVVLDADFSELPELQDDLSKLLTSLQALFDRGILTGNEVREAIKYEASPNPLHNQYFIAGNYSPLEDMNAPNEPDLDV